MTKFLSVLFTKENLQKIILVQVIVLLFLAMFSKLGVTVTHKGYIDVDNGVGAFEIRSK